MKETLIGVLIGAVLAFLIEIFQNRREDINQKSHAASLLYCDLKSIEDYLKNERSSVNIRYSTEWQNMISKCQFFKDDMIVYLYRIYDEIYNYNYHYKLIEKTENVVVKENIQQYRNLRELFFDSNSNTERKNVEYENILMELKHYIRK